MCETPLGHVNVVIPMAGRGQRFVEASYELPKPLIQVLDQPMIWWAMQSFDFLSKFDSYKLIFVTHSSLADHYDIRTYLFNEFGTEHCELVVIHNHTRGQAETVLAAKQFIDTSEKLIVFNCDTFTKCDITQEIIQKNPYGIVPCFNSDEPRFSYVRLDEIGHVVETAEKRVISNHATAGMYYFRRGSDFVEAAEFMISNHELQNGEFYVVPCYNRMIGNGKTVTMVMVTDTWPLGTPDELKQFLEAGGRSSIA